MEPTTETEIYSTADLVGFWQFPEADTAYFGVLERDAGEPASTLVIGRLGAAGGTEIVKRISSPDTSIHALDARRFGREMVFVTELNRGTPLQLARVDVAELLDPEVPRVRFEGQEAVGMGAGADTEVEIPFDRLWNVADFLAPERWLFSPRIVVGGTPPARVVANTSDGQAVVLGPTDGSTEIEAPDAAEPQAYRGDAGRYLVFKRPGEDYFPFWALSRYAGTPRPAPEGDLLVRATTGETNLSEALGLGSVAAFTLAAGPDGRPWIFAVPSGDPELVAVARAGNEWRIVGRWPLDQPTERLSVHHVAGTWHVLYAVRSEGWSLRHRTLTVE